MPNTPAKVAANKRWYELNKAKHHAICYQHGIKYYATHKDKLCEKARMKYLFNKEFLILRNIDLFEN
jgi:hypothetical protein